MSSEAVPRHVQFEGEREKQGQLTFTCPRHTKRESTNHVKHVDTFCPEPRAGLKTNLT